MASSAGGSGRASGAERRLGRLVRRSRLGRLLGGRLLGDRRWGLGLGRLLGSDRRWVLGLGERLLDYGRSRRLGDRCGLRSIRLDRLRSDLRDRSIGRRVRRGLRAAVLGGWKNRRGQSWRIEPLNDLGLSLGLRLRLGLRRGSLDLGSGRSGRRHGSRLDRRRLRSLSGLGSLSDLRLRGIQRCVRLVDRLEKLSVRCDDEVRLEAERAAHVLDRELVRRIGDRDDELVVLVAKRQRNLEAGILLRQRAQRVRTGVRGGDLDEREALLAGEHAAQILLRDPTALEQNLSEALAGAHHFLQGLLELLFGEQAGAEDERSERHVDHRRGRKRGRLDRGGRRSGRGRRLRSRLRGSRDRRRLGRSRRGRWRNLWIRLRLRLVDGKHLVRWFGRGHRRLSVGGLPLRLGELGIDEHELGCEHRGRQTTSCAR